MDLLSPLLGGAKTVWSFFSNAFKGRQLRGQQLRESMMSDARDFTTGVQQAVVGIRDAVQQPARQMSDVSVVWEAHPEVVRRVNEAEARLARVHLDFGPDSPAGTAAEAAIDELRQAANVLQPGITDLQGSVEAARRAEENLREFNRAAGQAIRR